MSEEEKILKTIRYCANDYMKQEDGIQCFEWGDLWVLNEYIEKIKQENQRLKEDVKSARSVYEGLLKIIDKAEKFIEGSYYSKNTTDIDSVVISNNKLLQIRNILRGKDE